MVAKYSNRLIINMLIILLIIIYTIVFFINNIYLYNIYLYNIYKPNIENFNNWDNNIDGIIYINLENREDRKVLILKELKKINTNMKKVNKVSGIYTPNNGHKGCVQSHIIALNIAIMNNWKYTLILEDDIELIVSPYEFNNMVSSALDYMIENNIDWDVIMLATVNAKKYYSNEYLSKVINATTASGYIINSKYYKKLLDLFEKCNMHMSKDKWSVNSRNEPYALDQQWLNLQETDNWFAFNNDLITQRLIRSTTMEGI